MSALNLQMAEKPIHDSFGCIEVHSIFWTIQGEGPYTGRPAVFIRLAGCNLQCPRCDTDYTSKRQRMSLDYIYHEVTNVGHSVQHYDFDFRPLVVITGGEPFRQDIIPLLNYLARKGRDVQVETNGTIFDPVCNGEFIRPEHLSIVCSPKTPLINDRIKPYVTALKYVLDGLHVDEKDGLPTTTLGSNVGVARPWPGFTGKIYVQPADAGADLIGKMRNRQAAVDSCMKFGYTLSLQTHKILDLP